MNNREIAFDIYKDKKGKIAPKEIAELLNEDPANVRKWKNNDKWNDKLGIRSSKRGAPKRNKNANGSCSGGAPKGNLNGFRHGENIPPERFSNKSFLAKYLPKVTQKIMQDISDSGFGTLDIMWSNIEIHFAAILRSQNIMFVKNQKDLTKEVKKEKSFESEKGSVSETDYIVQFAWDKQERFLNTMSKAIKTLESLMKSYEELLHKNWDIATEEQKLRLEKLKAEINNLTGDDKDKENGNLKKLLDVFKMGPAE